MKLVPAVVALLAAGLACAGNVQSLDALGAAAVAAVEAAAPTDARVVVIADPLDPRLRVAACDGELRAESPNLERPVARLAVAVACSGSQGWTIRVPVRLEIHRQVLVTRRPMARGDLVAAADLMHEERDTARLGYGYLLDPVALEGRRLRRPLAAGSVLTPAMLAAREVVERGQQVRIVANLANLVVRAMGTALEGGDEGDLIRVRSTSCDCIVHGRIDGPGSVATLP